MLPRSPVSTREWWPLPLSATLAVVAIGSVGLEPRVIPALYLAAVTPALSAADVRERRLPNGLVLPGYAAAGLGIAGDAVSRGEVSMFSIVGGVAFFGVFLLIAALGGMGLGDVKLVGVLGLAAGLVSATALAVVPLAAFLLGGVAAVAALRGAAASSIPFGPYLLAGFWIALLVSERP